MEHIVGKYQLAVYPHLRAVVYAQYKFDGFIEANRRYKACRIVITRHFFFGRDVVKVHVERFVTGNENRLAFKFRTVKVSRFDGGDEIFFVERLRRITRYGRDEQIFAEHILVFRL